MKALAIFLLAIPVALAEQPALVPFTDAQVKAILALGPWPPPLPTDPSNRVSGKPAAIAFGERLFGDASLSRPGTVERLSLTTPMKAPSASCWTI